jgi:4-hydroxyphenylpyruvate dioxygenase
MPQSTNPESSSLTRIGAPGDLSLVDVDHIELYVGNAKQAAYYYAAAFGFRITAYRGLETGCRDAASYLLEQGNIRIVLTTGLESQHPAAEFVQRFGDGVLCVAFTVADAGLAYEITTGRGGISAVEPHTVKGPGGQIELSSIKTIGEVIHTFVQRKAFSGCFMPGFEPIDPPVNRVNADGDCGLLFVDHLVGNVEQGQMNTWVKWYEDVMGFTLFKHFDDSDISTEYSALMSKVMDGGHGLIKIPINEPATGKRRSQIQEYLDFNSGSPGIQHVAFRTADALKTVGNLRDRGVDFLRLPDTYYELIWDRVGDIAEDHEQVRDLGILVDRDDQGYLLQIFTCPVEDRPTLFYEIIQRCGSQSFGKGNFKALFESLELEQERRGNL